MEKVKKISAWVISSLMVAMYLFSAYNKLANPAMMEQMKLGDWGTIIAIGEIVSALLFLVPATNRYGSFLLSAYMGGAIIIHMTSGTSILMPSAFLILVWVVAYLRNPEMFGCKCK